MTNNIIHSFLFQASLPLKFWIESLLIVFSYPQSSSNTTPSYKAPFEILFGFFPSYNYLCVFGCLCYPNTTSTIHKVARRSSACFYLGHSLNDKGYRCVDLIMQHVFLSDYDHLTYEDDTPFIHFSLISDTLSQP